LTVDDYINTQKTTADAWYYAVRECLKREVKEETGLDVDKLNYLLDLAFIRPDGIPVVTLSYYGDYVSGDVQLNEESVDYRWVTAEEANQYDLIEGIQDEIKMVDKIKKNGQNG